MNYGALGTMPGHWMDLRTAADYVGVRYGELVDAVTNRQVRATTTLPQRLGDWMVPMVDVELWAKHRSHPEAVLC